jgi:hypothetical protein
MADAGRHRRERATQQESRTLVVLSEDSAVTHHWHVTANGIVTGTGISHAARLCILTPTATADLLDIIHNRRPPVLASPPAPVSRQPVHRAGQRIAHLELLGGCDLNINGERQHLNRNAVLQILAYLAVHPEGATIDELTHVLWPQLPPASIRQRVHTSLSDLRKQLRPLLRDDPINRYDDRYRLNTRVISTDIQAWRTLTQTLSNSVATTVRHQTCLSLIDLYRGELAAGWTWTWLTATREQIRRELLDACATLAATEQEDALYWPTGGRVRSL